MIGESRKTKFILKCIGMENLEKIESWINNIKTEDFINIKDVNIFSDIVLGFMSDLSEDELLDLRKYTGTEFKNINSILRGNWTYEENGYLDEEKKNRYLKDSYEISRIVSKFQSLPINIKTYRGVDILTYKGYGINSLEQLESLKNKYIYEEAFSSTSLEQDKSFFEKKFKNGKNYNIEITYLISSECSDGVIINNSDLSYYGSSEAEFLINKGSLSKVVDVQIDKVKNCAKLTYLLIPNKMWNLDYRNESVIQNKR